MSSWPGRFRTEVRRLFSSLMVLCLLGTSVEASERRLSVDASQIRGALTERISDVHAVEVKLKDDSAVIGKLVSAGHDELRVRARTGGERAIPYAQVVAIRLDLGASRGWQIAGGVLGAYIGGGVTGFLTMESSDSTGKTAVLIGLGAGAFLGTKLGGRHRKILVIEVK